MSEDLVHQLAQAVEKLDVKGISSLAQRALDAGLSPLRVIEGLSQGMSVIGEAFKRGEVFLPEVMVAADVYKAGFEVVRPHFGADEEKSFLGTMVIGSIYGDVHTVGKDVASAVFQAAGFNVIDLGITVADEAWIQAIREHNPQILGLGTYMTSTFMHTKEVVRLITEAGLRERVKIICGGPSVDDAAAKKMGADGASNNAWEAVEIMRAWLTVDG